MVKALRRARADIADGLTALAQVQVAELRSEDLGEVADIIERLREQLSVLQRAVTMQSVGAGSVGARAP